MKKKIKILSVAIATMVMVGFSIIYVSCEKSSPSKEEQILTKKGESLDLEIAYCKKGSNEISMTFDREVFEKMFAPIADSLLGKDYVYEYIKVVDDDIWKKKSSLALQISFFNVEEGASYNFFLFDIYKSFEGGDVRYYMNAKPNSNDSEAWTFITCKSENCPEGCNINGKNCTPCPESHDPNAKPNCKKEHKQALEVVLGPLITLAVAIIGLIKKSN